MRMSIKLLLGFAAVFTATQLANSSIIGSPWISLPSLPTDYPDIPNTPQYECLLKAKDVFLDIIAKFEAAFSNVSSGAASLLGNLTVDIRDSLKKTSIYVVYVLHHMISTGFTNAAIVATLVDTIIIQSYQTHITELKQAVANIAGYLGTSAAPILAKLTETFARLGLFNTSVMTAINSVPATSVEKLTCCLRYTLEALQASPFIVNYITATTNIVSIAEQIASGSAVSPTLITQLKTAVDALPAGASDLLSTFKTFIKCSEV